MRARRLLLWRLPWLALLFAAAAVVLLALVPLGWRACFAALRARAKAAGEPWSKIGSDAIV